MVNITFVSAAGERRELEMPTGKSLMENAVRGGIDGIDADCGGELSCATCHVRIEPEWLAHLVPPAQDELDMLDYAPATDERSRLSCQILVTDALDGLIVHIPASQS